MDKIYFATTNEGKLKEAKEILGIEVIGTPLEIDEIQSLDPIEVATKKARAYYKELKKPIVVEDVAFTFNALGKLPGTYINDFLKNLGNDGLIDLLKNKKNRTAVAQTTLVYVNKGKESVFTGTVEGKITLKQKGKNGFGFDAIFIPNGFNKTFAEMDMDEKIKYSMRGKAFRKFKKWLSLHSA